MGDIHTIDTRYDVRTDAGGGDPDSYSATLRRYHQLLWSKPLPSGDVFTLDERLRHSSALGEFALASDAITHTYRDWSRPAKLVEVIGQIPAEEVTEFYDLGCTVGAYLVFPYGALIDGKYEQSINQRRGTLAVLHDRFDLTLECIRLHYQNADSPLADVLGRHKDFFDLFNDFPGYVDFFLLNDLVESDYSTIRFWKDFHGFDGDSLPDGSPAEYREYARRSMEFITARNVLIEDWSRRHLGNPSDS
jgi:hypothetical protein